MSRGVSLEALAFGAAGITTPELCWLGKPCSSLPEPLARGPQANPMRVRQALVADIFPRDLREKAKALGLLAFLPSGSDLIVDGNI